MNHRKNGILGLLAQTSIHAGTGQHTGTIDLPIQREGHNGWPCVFGSAVKGALRAHAEEAAAASLTGQQLASRADYRKLVQERPQIAAVFGPPTDQAADHAGALIVTDARLLLLPVRSLTSQFKWVTCPTALRRMQRDAEWLGLALPHFEVPDVIDAREDRPGRVADQSVNGPGSLAAVPLQSGGDALYLEEYRFDPQPIELDALIAALAELMQRAGGTEQLQRQLVIVSDDSFSHLADHATPVNAHVALDPITKTASGGALWYEETLPPETLLYVGLSANRARVKVKHTDTLDDEGEAKPDSGALDAAQVLGEVIGLFETQPWLQVGGNETLGMGWCAVKTLLAGDTGRGEG